MLLDHARIAKQAKITESEVASCGERAGEVPRIVKWKTIALETPHDVMGELRHRAIWLAAPVCDCVEVDIQQTALVIRAERVYPCMEAGAHRPAERSRPLC